MKRLLLLLLAVPALLLGQPAGAAQAGTSAGQVVVVGVPGLRWSDVDPARTPRLAALARAGAVGALSVRTAGPLDCPADGWLTLGAGNRVVAAGERAGTCAAGLPAASSLPEQIRLNADRREGARPGLLGATLRQHGVCMQAEGAGAALAAAGSGSGTGCPVFVREAAAVGGTGSARAAAATQADRAVAEADRTRVPGSTLIVLGLSEAAGDASGHLHVALAAGPGFRTGALVSASTRRAPYVQLVDVAPTVLAVFGIRSPAAMVGEPWQATARPISLAALRDQDTKATAQRQATVPFFVLLVAAQLVLLGLAAWRRWWRTAELVALAGTCAVGASYLANLLPWWRVPPPLAGLLVATAAFTAGLTALSLLGRGLLARAGIACGVTALILVADLVTGAHLQMSSVGGYSPLVAGRFAGIGNVAFGVLAASALLAAASTRSATVAALTAIVVVVDGAPLWGSDVGGVLALVPAYAVLVLRLAGRRVNLARLALATLAGMAVVAAFGVADHARPADEQTHLGRFVGEVLDGTAGTVLVRKADANVLLLFHSPVTALLPVVAAVLLLLFLRPPPVLRRTFERDPSWRAGLLAVLTASGLGFVLNDSGAAVPALAILVALPATVAVTARHARQVAANR
ncbi:MAG: hypothetical protein JWN35_2542 [Frankiales bacterium]|jgi:hypothetical protein|nr:hypothetical protein [Frankiales bacterium]